MEAPENIYVTVPPINHFNSDLEIPGVEWASGEGAFDKGFEDGYVRSDLYTAALERIAELEAEAKASHIFHEGHESQMEYLRERMAELERQGYTLAMRLLQSDIVLDDVETAARNALLSSWRTPSE